MRRVHAQALLLGALLIGQAPTALAQQQVDLRAPQPSRVDRDAQFRNRSIPLPSEQSFIITRSGLLPSELTLLRSRAGALPSEGAIAPPPRNGVAELYPDYDRLYRAVADPLRPNYVPLQPDQDQGFAGLRPSDVLGNTSSNPAQPGASPWGELRIDARLPAQEVPAIPWDYKPPLKPDPDLTPPTPTLAPPSVREALTPPPATQPSP